MENQISKQFINSYKFKSITSPILSSIFELVNVGSIGHLIVFNELYGIVHDGREADLTKLYYAKSLIYHVKHYLSSQKLKELFKLPPQRQSLEKAAYYFAEVFQSNDFLDTEYEEISSGLDKLALKVQSYLRSSNSNHPAISIRLFSPDEPLESSPYSHGECIEVFQCINHNLVARGFLRANVIKEIHRVLLNKVIETREGNDITLSIIYSAVCHRLGILLLPTIRNNRYKLKWISPNPDTIVFINPVEGRFEYLYNSRSGVCIDDCPTRTIMCHLAADSFHIARENSKNISTDIDMVAAAGMVLLLESVSEDYNQNILDDVLGYCVKYEVHLEYVVEICQKIFRNCTEVDKKMKSLSTYAEDKLNMQKNGPRSLEMKRRKFVDVKFATGMIMHQKFTPEHGVIFGWDK
ncbi:F-box only protein 21, partial [Armadillidium vulgare]